MSDVFKLVGRIVIDSQEAQDAIQQTTEDAKTLAVVLEGAGGSADGAGKKMGSSGKMASASVWLGNMFTTITNKAASMGKALGQTGFEFDAAMEAYRNQFEALIGDSDKAHQLVDDLQLLAKVSPLGMEGLANNAVSLLNSGTQLADIIPTLEMLGNLALGDTNKMNSIVRAYTQILSKGQLMAQEMYQMGDAGVPIREIMTMYGGAEYADGEWYARKMTDPSYKIMAEDMVTALKGATAEGGKWHNYMFQMMDTWVGQTDRMGEEGKESLGAFMLPFFEMAKSDVLPRLSESLAGFGTWVTENQGTLQKMADTMSMLVTEGFDKLIGAFTWMMENGEATALAIGTIATAMTVGAIAAHPYAAAVLAVAAGLAMLASAPDDPLADVFDGYSNADLELLQRWIDAANEAKSLEDTMFDDTESYVAARDRADALRQEVDAVEGLGQAYSTWLSSQAGYKGESDMYLSIPTKLQDNAETSLQTELDGMSLESLVKMVGDTSGLYSAVNATNLTAYVNMVPSGIAGGVKVSGSHADGLDRVPYDGYIAELHRDEAVLTASQAAAWRSGSTGGNTGRVESMLTQAIGVLQQIVSNTSASTQVVLDSGVLVGQLAPQMDAQLGTILNRKGRRN
jgi:hypothetical protein